MLSIIVPAYNQHEFTEECLITLLETTQDFEVVVVDNGSDPPIHPPFSGFVETRVIRNDENKGFPVAVNQGIRDAKGDIIVVLNNDVVVTPGALNRLAEWLDEYAIVGPMTNYCAGLQRVQLPAYETKEEMFKEARYFQEENKGISEEVNYIIGFCMVFKKQLWEELGPFDESLWPCSGEEIDFCLRAGQKGYRIGIAHDVYVHHYGSQTFQSLQDDKVLDYVAICKRNDAHLAERWGKDFWKQKQEPSPPNPSGLCLNLGCGMRHLPGYVNIDNRHEALDWDEENKTLFFDITKPLPFGDGSVDMVRAYDILEHISSADVIPLMNEIWRVLKPGAVFESLTPDAEMGQGAFQDPTHRSFWVENSWLYYSLPEWRNLYGIKADFNVESIERVQTDSRVYHLHVVARARK